jgi:hypothetical protein
MDAHSEKFAMCLEFFPGKMTRQQFETFFNKVFPNSQEQSLDSFWTVYQQTEQYLDAVEYFHGFPMFL